MNKINTENNASYDFVAPSIADDSGKKSKTVFPTAELVKPDISSYKADVPVRRQMTIMDLGSISAETTVNLIPEPHNLNVGAIVAIRCKIESTSTTTVDVIVKVGDDTVATLKDSGTKLLLWDGEGFDVIG